jgi:hypothetical protein
MVETAAAAAQAIKLARAPAGRPRILSGDRSGGGGTRGLVSPVATVRIMRVKRVPMVKASVYLRRKPSQDGSIATSTQSTRSSERSPAAQRGARTARRNMRRNRPIT